MAEWMISTDTVEVRIKEWTTLTRNIAKQLLSKLQKELETELEEEVIDERSQSRLFEKEELLIRYGRMPVYKRIADHVEKQLEDVTKIEDVAKMIGKYYKEDMGRDIEQSSMNSYASIYGRYFEEEKKIIKRDKIKKIWIKVTEEEREDEKKKLAEEILKLAEKNNWDQKIPMPLSTIARMSGETEEKIIEAISYLIQKGFVSQRPKNKIAFLR